MDNFGLTTVVFLGTALRTIRVVTAQTCEDCYCQLTNAERLSQLVEQQVNSALEDEPRKLQTITLIFYGYV